MAVRSTRGRLVLIGAGAVAAGLLVPSMANAATAKAQWGDFDRTGTEFMSLYPGKVTVSKGDKVQFAIVGFHTATFLGKGQKLPAFIQASSTLNPPKNDPGGAPYWWGGVTPLLQINGAAFAPAGGKVVTGRKTVSSGVLPGDAPKFTVTFPKTGTFHIRCIIHPGMKGTIRVVPKSGDTAAKRTARAKAELKAQAATVKALVKKATRATTPTVSISPGTKKAQTLSFQPANKKVAPGTTVTFNMDGGNEVHTVTFGPKAFVEQLAKTTFQGQGVDLPAEGTYASDPPTAGVPSLTPTTHGNGFLNSGVLNDKGVGPLPRSFKITFGTPGIYTYICLVHPEMKGTITVG
jgi:plastocyanin